MLQNNNILSKVTFTSNKVMLYRVFTSYVKQNVETVKQKQKQKLWYNDMVQYVITQR